jgi:putative tricarboxylic transport membrane protein
MRIRNTLAACALVLLTAPVHAQWKPERNVEIVVPSAPGGSNDKTARSVERIIHDKRLMAATLTVVNKPAAAMR